MTQVYRDQLTVLHSRWATAGQRVLLLARRVIHNSEVDAKEFESSEAADYIVREQIHDLVAVGMIGIVDPPRPETPEVVRICREGGIRVFMVSFPLGAD